MAFVFTGHASAEGSETILNELAKHGARASFFFTGDFLTNGSFTPLVHRVVKEGHYLGPHSDKHLLYCSREQAKQTLVTCNGFKSDLAANLQKTEHARMAGGELRPREPERQPFEMSRTETRYFLPPYAHYNRDIAQWTLEMGFTLISFTPGTRSNADYTGEADTNYVSSQAIFDSIVKQEHEDPHGLNGFILLLHIGSGPGRAEKLHTRFGELLDFLSAKGYQFVRVDELLEPSEAVSQQGDKPKQ